MDNNNKNKAVVSVYTTAQRKARWAEVSERDRRTLSSQIEMVMDLYCAGHLVLAYDQAQA